MMTSTSVADGVKAMIRMNFNSIIHADITAHEGLNNVQWKIQTKKDNKTL